MRIYESEMIALRQQLRCGQHQLPRRRLRAIHEVHDHLLERRSDLESLARGVARVKDALLVNFRFHAFDLVRWLPPHLRESAEAAASPSEPEPRLRRLIRRSAPRRSDEAPETDSLLRGDRSHRYTWLEVQALGISERAEDLRDSCREIGEVAMAMVEATSAQANLRLQRQIAILTWLLAIIGAVTLVVAILALR